MSSSPTQSQCGVEVMKSPVTLGCNYRERCVGFTPPRAGLLGPIPRTSGWRGNISPRAPTAVVVAVLPRIALHPHRLAHASQHAGLACC